MTRGRYYRLPDDVIERLDYAAMTRRVPRAEVIRRMLADLPEPPAEWRQARRTYTGAGGEV